MKLKKMLKKLMAFLDADVKQQRKDLTSLRKMLKELKQKEQALMTAFDESVLDENREDLQNKLDVVRAQRAKGKQHLLALRAEREPSSTDCQPNVSHQQKPTD
ncbi:MAG: hypothetical protein IBX48_07815 [Thiomicrospira sp.]|uniref:hypothetical protein n=1 Tax=Thiomicrospira sp. TaxID=935 RepID=UPI0019E18A1D|nr:hypothetical protein [Thiomicrospira sp.]MBE0494235.1 hypothetical protein [Thiomicrospira sp.]